MTNNKKNNSKKISVIYGTKNTTSSDGISNIQKSLTDNDYQIELDYDSNDYVSKVIIKN